MPIQFARPSHWAISLSAVVLAACGGSGGSSPSAVEGDIQIRALSNRADLISDGDAYLEIVLPTNAVASDLKVDVDGTDVTASFAPRPNGRILGVVTGLPVGASNLNARLASAGKGAKLQITNHGRGGPVFAGAQLQPWVCATPTPMPVTVVVPGTGLSGTVTTHASKLDAPPTDAACNTPSKYTYYYQPVGTNTTTCTTIVGATPCYVKYDPASRPADAAIADFTNDRGDTVKALLRLEEGVIDRGGYQILAYFDPAQPWQPWAPQKGWNGKLQWRTGGSSGASQFQDSAAIGVFSTQTTITVDGIFERNGLSRGYIIATGQHTQNGQNINPIVAAEQMMMIKEHIGDTYGEIRFTMGDGVSGGSTQANLISSVMPGLLQGHLIGLTFPDSLTAIIGPTECSAIARYVATPAGSGLSSAQRIAVQGNSPCPTFDALQNARLGSNCGGLLDRVGLSVVAYDPVTRPLGFRCSMFDTLSSVLGTVVDQDRNVKVEHSVDNAGVQYGLQALTNGAITPEQFVQLNEGVGSFDRDFNWSGGTPTAPIVPAPRFRALPDMLARMYTAGLVSNSRNLAKVPIIDMRTNTNGDIHEPRATTGQRARLDAVNGTHANFVTRAMGVTIFPSSFVGPALFGQSFDAMDHWLGAIEADTSSKSLEQKVLDDRPATLHDGCYNSAGATSADLATEVPLADPTCPVSAALLFKDPRQVAGGPTSDDILKCQLKPFDPTSADYAGIVFSATQITRLRAVFTDGVCDWTKPGVGQSTAAGGNLTFTGGPGGQPLPQAPASVPL